MSSEIPAPKKLLSLDGGGVRGISSMIILKAIMDKVKELEQAAGVGDDEERLPCRYFDLAGGTSTGGLAALMLFRLEMSVSEVIEKYDTMAASIFSNRGAGPFYEGYGGVGGALKGIQNRIERIPLIGHLLNISDAIYYVLIFGGFAQYSGEGLISAVDQIAKPREEGGEKAPLVDDSKTKTLLFTTIHEDGCKGVMRSYTPPEKQPDAPEDLYPQSFWKGITLGKAARATAAAPLYFPWVIVNDRRCEDGGLLNNNPVERVWDARFELSPDGGKAPDVSLVVSIGTAKGPRKNSVPRTAVDVMWDILLNPGKAFDTIASIISVSTSNEEPHRDFQQRMYYRNMDRAKPTKYCRLNADVGEGRCIELDDVAGMGNLRQDTEDWLAKEEARKLVKECAELLMKRALSMSAS